MNNNENSIYYECMITVDADHMKKTLTSPVNQPMKTAIILNYIAFAVLTVFGAAILLVPALIRNLSGMRAFIPSGILALILAIYQILKFPAVYGAIQFKRCAKGRKQFACRLRFDGEKIVSDDETGDIRSYYYSNITGVYENDEAFNLLIDNAVLLRVPKTSFVFGDPVSFGGFIRSVYAPQKYSAKRFNTGNVMVIIAIVVFFLLLCFQLFWVFVDAFLVLHEDYHLLML